MACAVCGVPYAGPYCSVACFKRRFEPKPGPTLKMRDDRQTAGG